MLRRSMGEMVLAPDATLRRLRDRRSLRVVLIVIGLSLLFSYVYVLGLHATWNNADLVRGLLMGSDMAHGNVLLNHWSSSPDSFWTIDLVLFAVGILIVGVKVELLHIASTLIWSALIVTAMYLASSNLKGAARNTSMITVFVIIGLPSLSFESYLASTMVHVGTCLYTLLAFLGLKRGRFGWGWVFAVAFFAAGALGDPLIVAYGLAPALLVGLLEMERTRRWRRGAPMASAPLVAVAVAFMTRKVAEIFGTYRLVATHAVGHGQLLHNLREVYPATVALLGLGSGFSQSKEPFVLELFRTFSLVVVSAGVVVGAVGIVRRAILPSVRRVIQTSTPEAQIWWRLSDLLLLASIGSGITYVDLAIDSGGERYLTAGVVFAGILGAAYVGRAASVLRSGRIRLSVMAAVALVVVCNIVGVGVTLSQPVNPVNYMQLARFLRNHGLTHGVGDYWTSATTTVYSSGMVTVRQVVPGFGGSLVPYLYLSTSQWYTDSFQFLVYDTSKSTGAELRDDSKYPFSPVKHLYKDGTFRIIVWKSPLTFSGYGTGFSAPTTAVRPYGTSIRRKRRAATARATTAIAKRYATRTSMIQ